MDASEAEPSLHEEKERERGGVYYGGDTDAGGGDGNNAKEGEKNSKQRSFSVSLCLHLNFSNQVWLFDYALLAHGQYVMHSLPPPLSSRPGRRQSTFPSPNLQGYFVKLSILFMLRRL